MIDDGPPNLGPAIRAIVETYVPDQGRWPDAEVAIGAVIYVETVGAERAVAERKAAIGYDEIRNMALIEARNALADYRKDLKPGPLFQVANECLGLVDALRYKPAPPVAAQESDNAEIRPILPEAARIAKGLTEAQRNVLLALRPDDWTSGDRIKAEVADDLEDKDLVQGSHRSYGMRYALTNLGDTVAEALRAEAAAPNQKGNPDA